MLGSRHVIASGQKASREGISLKKTWITRSAQSKRADGRFDGEVEGEWEWGKASLYVPGQAGRGSNARQAANNNRRHLELFVWLRILLPAPASAASMALHELRQSVGRTAWRECHQCLRRSRIDARRSVATSAAAPVDEMELEQSSLRVPQLSPDVAGTFDPVGQSKLRRKQLPPSRSVMPPALMPQETCD
jgi:hypothetical protein